MAKMKRYAMIMAGGAGERFWPLSRIKKPKHLWNVTGADACLLELTLKRVSKLVDFKNIFIVSNAEQCEAILEVCPTLSHEQLVAEPLCRDTTAAIALGSILVEKLSGGDDASFAVFPSDHLISDDEAFVHSLNEAFGAAEKTSGLLTIGIKPTFPATGYGYIQKGKKLDGFECFKVNRFFEKPNAERAESYVASGQFYWNAGIFVWKNSAIQQQLRENAFAESKVFEDMRKSILDGCNVEDALAEFYPKIEKISIDFSVMEKAKNAWVVPAGFGWDDVGSWSAIERHYQKDLKGNIAVGEFFEKDANNCVVFDVAGRATAIVGVSDLIVVHSKDATLICRKHCAEDLKTLVRQLPQKFR